MTVAHSNTYDGLKPWLNCGRDTVSNSGELLTTQIADGVAGYVSRRDGNYFCRMKKKPLYDDYIRNSIFLLLT